MKRDILIIEDDRDIVELLQYNLERERYEVRAATSGEAGLDEARRLLPSLILLDLGLPGIQGLEVCRLLKLREPTADIPIIMLTARGEESDVVVGLEVGADDYVTKPFKVREVIARIRAVLRRSRGGEQPRDSDKIIVGPIEIDSGRHEVQVSGRLVEFTLAEFRLLKALAMNAGRVLTRDQLLGDITAGTAFIIDRNVDVHIRSIRKKLGAVRNVISTVRGVGYKMQAHPSESED